MKKLLTFVLVIFILPSAYGQEPSANLEKNKLLVRAFEAMAFAPSYKQGFAMGKKQSGKTNAYIEAVLSADNAQLNKIIAHVYAKYLSLEEAKELARFYESPTGKTLTAQQTRDPANPNPSLKLDSKQVAEARAFFNSPTGRAVTQLSQNQDIWKEVSQDIRLSLLPPAR